jgi:hypothetical protein
VGEDKVKARVSNDKNKKIKKPALVINAGLILRLRINYLSKVLI